MMNHPDQTLLHDFVDDELSREDRAYVAIHLEDCPMCSGVVAGLRDLREQARRSFAAPAVTPVPVPSDQWERIRERILSSPRAGGGAIDGLAHLPVGILKWAAAVTLVVGVSSLATWWTTRTGPAPGAGPPPATGPLVADGGTGTDYRSANLIIDAYQPVITDLQRLLDEGRGRFRPETIEVLEENLRIIDAAIADVERAVMSDPGHPGVLRSLDGVLQAKLDLLREAVGMTNGA
jgi:hypothetical protein